MNDTINRKAALDAVERNACNTRGVIDAINALPSAQQWVPCSERLPEEKTNQNTQDFEFVLCSTTFGDVRPYKFGKPIGWEEAHFWHGVGVMDKYVVAWMPLPEPYRAAEGGGDDD